MRKGKKARALLTFALFSGSFSATFIATTAPAANATGSYSIVSNGLVMNFDASISSSYTSNTWTDTTGNGHNATFTSGSYSSNNGGYLSFNGSSTYGNIGNLAVTDTFASGLSTTFYANFGANTQNWERIFDFGNGSGNNNILVARAGNTDTLWYEIYNATGITQGTCSAPNSIQNNAWAWYAITTNGSTCAIFVNGVAQTVTTSAGGSTFTVTPATIARTNNFIGRSNWSGDGWFDSGIGKLAIYNRGLSSAEVYQNYQAQADTCNATQTSSGGATIFKITNTGACNWFKPSNLSIAEALIVGGGGGGGFDVAGGGGSGGLLYYGAENPKTPNGSALTLSQESYTVTVGAGGAGSTAINSAASNGGDSSFNGYTAKGGGYGNSRNLLTTAGTGGSGGGGGFANGTNASPGLSGGNGTSNQGYGGGNGSTSADAGGGGGGAGASGANRSGTSTTGAEGKGGDGLSYSITGTATYYAGGGGGGAYNSVGGKGGQGGGGHGGNSTLTTCQTIFSDCGSTEVSGRQGKSGTANTGGGGGGSGNEGTTNYPGDGGSGVVILRFSAGVAAATVNSITFSTQVKKLLANTITATVSSAGRVTFYANNRMIPRCSSIATTAVSPFTAQCIWKPITHGQINITTSFVPNDSGYSNASGGTNGTASKRTTAR